MRIAVFGTGGVGGYFGGRLAQAGEEVVFIARGEHLQAMRANGLRVDSINGDFHVKPVQATDDPKQVGVVDAVLACVKSWQVPDAALAMRPMVGEDTFVVPLENGVDAPAELANILGKDKVLGGLCHIVSFVAGPGHIKHAGIDPDLQFGEMNKRHSQRAERLREAFENAGVNVRIPDDIQVAMWEKFLFISAMSGVGGLTRAPAGVMRTVPETRELLVRAMREVVTVAHANEVGLAEDTVDKTMAFIDKLPYAATASMQRDIIEGRPSELASQNGAVVRMGLERGILTPTHTDIYAALLPQELRARGEVKF